MNLPIEMKPMSPAPGDFNASLAAAGLTSTRTARDYWCGNPGGTTADNNNLSSSVQLEFQPHKYSCMGLVTSPFLSLL